MCTPDDPLPNWQETFDHDRWGNRWVVSGSTSGVVVSGLTPTASTWFTPKNRLNLATGNFDRAGNQLKVNPFTLTYDAENRQTAAASVSNGSAAYAYDGEGRRVKKVTGGANRRL